MANTLDGNSPLENDDTPVNSKTWTCDNSPNETAQCQYRYKVDDNPISGTTCTSPTFTDTDSYSETALATKSGGNGKYCIHIQAKDQAGNESLVTSVYATLDSEDPNISGVSVPEKTYLGGDRIDITVSFDEPIVVTGDPPY